MTATEISHVFVIFLSRFLLGEPVPAVPIPCRLAKATQIDYYKSQKKGPGWSQAQSRYSLGSARVTYLNTRIPAMT